MVRLLIQHQIQYPTLCQWLKDVYVRVADQEFPVAGKPQSDSRITLLTGVHRKEVRRIRSEDRAATRVPAAIPLGGTLVANWVGDPRYQDVDGKPLPLPRLAKGSNGPSFEELVANKSKDIRPRVVLDELLRLGICRLDETDRVWLNMDAFVPDQGFEEKAYFLGRNVHDHLAAGIHNLDQPENPYIERSVYYDKLTREDVQSLAEYAQKVGMEALLKVNRKALALQRRSKKQKNATQRMNFGVYYFLDHSDGNQSMVEKNSPLD